MIRLMNVDANEEERWLDTGEEDGYLICPLAFCHLASKEHNASIVGVRCLLTSSAFLPAPAPDASLHPTAYLLTYGNKLWPVYMMMI